MLGKHIQFDLKLLFYNFPVISSLSSNSIPNKDVYIIGNISKMNWKAVSSPFEFGTNVLAGFDLFQLMKI